jgi:adenosylmethionine-8-amino-7-oxononanoate aminotransferase
MHNLFRGVLAEHVFAERPPRELDAFYADRLAALMERHAAELAAVVVEPVVQGAGGMWFYDPAVVRLLRELCDLHGLLLVLDEIATGFGRTGELFACQHAGVAPDIMCVGKALTGGYLSLAAALCTADVAQAISQGGGGALMHGPTYMANPLACAAALASLGLLADGSWREDVARIEAGLEQGLTTARGLARVADVRVCGAIAVIQLTGPVDVDAATEAAVEAGVWLRPFRDLIYAMPPYVTADEDIDRICSGLIAAAIAGGEA